MASKETEPPFKCLGLAAKDHNGVDLSQTKQCVQISCPGHIDAVTQAHGWDAPSQDEMTSPPTAPLPKKALDAIHKDQGPLKGSTEHKQPQKQMGFAHCTLLGKTLCASVTCRPHVGFAITAMAKFLAQPTEIHCKCSKDIVTHLRQTQKWGMRHKMDHSAGPPAINLPKSDFSDPPVPLLDKLPNFPKTSK